MRWYRRYSRRTPVHRSSSASFAAVFSRSLATVWAEKCVSSLAWHGTAPCVIADVPRDGNCMFSALSCAFRWWRGGGCANVTPAEFRALAASAVMQPCQAILDARAVADGDAWAQMLSLPGVSGDYAALQNIASQLQCGIAVWLPACSVWQVLVPRCRLLGAVCLQFGVDHVAAVPMSVERQASLFAAALANGAPPCLVGGGSDHSPLVGGLMRRIGARRSSRPTSKLKLRCC